MYIIKAVQSILDQVLVHGTSGVLEIGKLHGCMLNRIRLNVLVAVSKVAKRRNKKRNFRKCFAHPRTHEERDVLRVSTGFKFRGVDSTMQVFGDTKSEIDFPSAVVQIVIMKINCRIF